MKKSKARLIQVFLMLMSLALFSDYSLAEPHSEADRSVQLSQEDYKIYLSTINKCAGVNRVRALWEGVNFQVAKSSATSAIQILTFNTNAYFEFIENKTLSPEFARILNSMGFYYALTDCYGTDDISKQAYFAGLLLSDAAGKIGSLKLAVEALASMRSLMAIGTVSPYVLSFFRAAGATGAIYLAYKTIQKELKPRSQLEKDEIDQVQKQTIAMPLLYVESAKIIISKRILELEGSLSSDSLTAQERETLTLKLQRLQGSLKNINDLQKKVS